MQKLDLFQLRGLSEIVIEKIMKDKNYIPFAQSEYYNNDSTKYMEVLQ